MNIDLCEGETTWDMEFHSKPTHEQASVFAGTYIFAVLTYSKGVDLDLNICQVGSISTSCTVLHSKADARNIIGIAFRQKTPARAF